MSTPVTAEKYPCYISIQDEVTGVSVELPSEKNGTLLLSTIASQFPGTVGLRFKSAAGTWRGVRITEDKVFDIPLEGWGSVDYQVVMADRPAPTATKRKIPANTEFKEEDDDEEEEEELSPLEKMKKMTEPEILSDLLVKNIPYECKEADIKAHFETYGELDFCELKYDRDGKHRGFGFIRFKTVEAVESCFSASHILHERELEVCYPKDKTKDDGTPNKLFIGRLPKELTEQEMQEYFEKFGDLRECYIPSPFKGFGFVSFKLQSAARKVLKSTHVLKGAYLNVGHPVSKKGDNNRSGRNSDWNSERGNFGGSRDFGGGNGGFGARGDFRSRGGFGGRGNFGGGGGYGRGPMMGAPMQDMFSPGMGGPHRSSGHRGGMDNYYGYGFQSR